MRLFNPKNMTEVLVGLHDIECSIQLPDEHWFFKETQIPKDKIIAINEKGEPILIDIN